MAVQLLDEDTRITVRDDELDDVQGGDADTTYTVRQIPPEKNRELSKKHTTQPINRRTGQREQVVDNQALVDDLVDYALVAWTGIQHKGQPVPCDREFKLLLDFPRKAALIALAGLNQVTAEQKEQSFRSPA